MKKISLFSWLIVLSILIFATSCGGGGGTPTQDTTEPIINEESFTPANGTIFTIGSSTITVKASVSDNEALASYTIDIHNNFDGHGSHTKAFEASTSVKSIEYTPFAVLIPDKKLSGKSATINESIEIGHFSPEGKVYQAGKYHLVLTVYDAAGNKAVSYREIELK